MRHLDNFFKRDIIIDSLQMKCIKYCIFAFFIAGQIFAETKENIAVLDFKALNVSKADAVAISEFVGIALVKTGKFNVLERSNIDKVLAEQGFQQTGCTTEECAVQIGKILNVEKAIIGTFTKISGLYFITAKVVDIETSKIIKSEKVQFENISNISYPIEELVSLITGKEIKSAEEKKKQNKPKPKSKHISNFGIGFHNLGGSLRYFAGIATLEAKYVYGNDFSALGPRIYINLNPKSNVVIYVGGEYCLIDGESEKQKFTGTAMGAFLGIEIFTSHIFSILIDIGFFNVTLESEYVGVRAFNSSGVCNIGLNMYF